MTREIPAGYQKSEFRWRQVLLLQLDGTLVLATAKPEQGMTAVEFSRSCDWNAREDRIVLRRGHVRCLRQEAGTGYMSPSSLPVDQVPADILAVLCDQPDNLFLFTKCG